MQDIDNNNENTENKEEGYEFIQETIKKRPYNVKRGIIRILFTVIMAVVFGAVAALAFVIFEPMLSKRFSPDTETAEEVKLERESISDNELVKDKEKTIADNEKDQDTEASVSENIVKESDPDKALAGDEKATDEAEDKGKGDPASKEGRVEDKDPSKVSLKTEESPEEKSQEEKSEEEAKENLIAKEELEVSDYTVLYKKIGDVAKEVRSSMVTVAGISPDTDWFMNSYENNNRAAGLILADNGKELLILTKTSVLNNANSIQVTFSDGNTYTAGLKTSDSNTNFSVIAIQLSKLKEETLETMTMADLGSSRGSSITGKPVIAVGDPLGVSDSIAIGQITSNAIVINMSDSNVGILTTDIYGSSKASGVLCDFEGRILGIICQDGSTIDAKNLIRAYAISDLKIRLEKILNGQEIAYLGIKGTDVTKEAMEELGIPKGAYVKEVIADSPAMRSGIQNGDVIVKLGTDEIASFGNYMDSILKYQPGETITLMVKRLGKEDYVDISYEIELGDAD